MPTLTLAKWMDPRIWLKVTVQAGMIVVTRTSLERAQTEMVRLQNKMGKKSISLWSMNKAELGEKARKDLGMMTNQLSKEKCHL